MLDFIFKRVSICNHTSISFYFGITVSAHQPICNRGSWVLCGLMVEVLSKCSKTSRGNTMVCNYFWTGSNREWCIWMFSFLVKTSFHTNLMLIDMLCLIIILQKKHCGLEISFASTLLLLPYCIILGAVLLQWCWCEKIIYIKLLEMKYIPRMKTQN